MIKVYRVLLAEDDVGTVEFVTAALERYNFQVQHAADGRFALRQLSEASFDLVLCDVMMPYVDGFKALEGAQTKNLPLPPVVMLTALHDQDSVLRAKKLGAVGYLAKPCTAPQLLSKVVTTLDLAEEDLVDKNKLPFSVNTGSADNEILITLLGCPTKNPMSDFIKAISREASLSGPHRGAQIDVGSDFAYANGAIGFLMALGVYLQKSYHISKPKISFTGAFFGAMDIKTVKDFQSEFTVF